MNEGPRKRLLKFIDGLTNIGTHIEDDRAFMPFQEITHVLKWLQSVSIRLKSNDVESRSPHDLTNLSLDVHFFVSAVENVLGVPA